MWKEQNIQQNSIQNIYLNTNCGFVPIIVNNKGKNIQQNLYKGTKQYG